MRRLETVGEVAARFARVEPAFPVGYFRRQIQHYVQIGLVRPPLYQGQGRTSAALFAERQICAAYLFSALTRLGLKAEQLRMIGRYVDSIGVPREDGEGYLRGLIDVIQDTKTDETRWFLIVKIRKWARDVNPDTPPVYGDFRKKADVTADAQ